MVLPGNQQREATPCCLHETGREGEEWQNILEKAVVHDYEACYLPQGIKTHRSQAKTFILGRICPICSYSIPK